MQELLLGSWGSQIVAFVCQYPWQVFSVVFIVGSVILHLFREDPANGDCDVFGFGGDGDGGGGGD